MKYLLQVGNVVGEEILIFYEGDKDDFIQYIKDICAAYNQAQVKKFHTSSELPEMNNGSLEQQRWIISIVQSHRTWQAGRYRFGEPKNICGECILTIYEGASYTAYFGDELKL